MIHITVYRLSWWASFNAHDSPLGEYIEVTEGESFT